MQLTAQAQECTRLPRKDSKTSSSNAADEHNEIELRADSRGAVAVAGTVGEYPGGKAEGDGAGAEAISCPLLFVFAQLDWRGPFQLLPLLQQLQLKPLSRLLLNVTTPCRRSWLLCKRAVVRSRKCWLGADPQDFDKIKCARGSLKPAVQKNLLKVVCKMLSNAVERPTKSLLLAMLSIPRAAA